MTDKSPPANRNDLVNLVASQINLQDHNLDTEAVGELVDMVLQGINQLATHSPYLQLREFGKFEIRHRKARQHPHPINGSGPVVIPARSVLWFTASRSSAQVQP